MKLISGKLYKMAKTIIVVVGDGNQKTEGFDSVGPGEVVMYIGDHKVLTPKGTVRGLNEIVKQNLAKYFERAM